MNLRELARRARRLRHSLWSCLPVPKPQKVVDLAFPPAMILRRERINAGVDADVANIKLRTLDKVRYLISGSTAEAACRDCHRRAPSLCDMWPSAVLNGRARSGASSTVPALLGLTCAFIDLGTIAPIFRRKWASTRGGVLSVFKPQCPKLNPPVS
jgi:hypothetical protein